MAKTVGHSTEILLTNGGFTIVDKEDFEFLSKWTWFSSGSGYAVRNAKRSDGSSRTVFMHRLILLSRFGEHSDHINRNRLDNRRSNLRKCTNAENTRNKGKQPYNTSGYKGIHRKDNRWIAQIRINYKNIHIGSYKTKEEAALAYNEKAKELHGEFACLNIIQEKDNAK